MNMPPYVFLCGGHDLEMVTITELLHAHVPEDQVIDLGLSWGARASAYALHLERCVSQNQIPVLIELQVDVALPSTAIIIDHHQERAGADRPTSLEQVFQLLQRPASQWTRWQTLVAANDRGYLPELARCGATRDEMLAIRAADRRCQGISAAEEASAVDAVNTRIELEGGRLTLVRLPHRHCSAVADRMEPVLGGPGYQNLLVSTPKGTSFFGTGDVIDCLRQSFPNSWWGGALPARGFWGSPEPESKVLPVVKHILAGIGSDPLQSKQPTCN